MANNRKRKPAGSSFCGKRKKTKRARSTKEKKRKPAGRFDLAGQSTKIPEKELKGVFFSLQNPRSKLVTKEPGESAACRGAVVSR